MTDDDPYFKAKVYPSGGGTLFVQYQHVEYDLMPGMMLVKFIQSVEGKRKVTMLFSLHAAVVEFL
jgi:hypothetical protein